MTAMPSPAEKEKAMMGNFWVDGKIDGRRSRITGGPMRKNEGLELAIAQRDRGEPLLTVKIKCVYDAETDECVTYIKDGEGNVLKEIRTKR